MWHHLVQTRSTVEPTLALTWIRQSPSHCGQLGEVLKLLPTPTINALDLPVYSGHLSNMANYFRTMGDRHIQTASTAYNIPAQSKQPTKLVRFLLRKTTVVPSIYKQSAALLSSIYATSTKHAVLERGSRIINNIHYYKNFLPKLRRTLHILMYCEVCVLS